MAYVGDRGLSTGLARRCLAAARGGSMKRAALVALVGLAVVMVPFAMWWYRMEREAAA